MHRSIVDKEPQTFMDWERQEGQGETSKSLAWMSGDVLKKHRTLSVSSSSSHRRPCPCSRRRRRQNHHNSNNQASAGAASLLLNCSISVEEVLVEEVLHWPPCLQLIINDFLS
jgi:hypothetical protein